jgi:hypothetical protein
MLERLLSIPGGADNLSLQLCGRNMQACINSLTICGGVKQCDA